MISEKYLTDSVIYKKYSGDGEDYTSTYEKYELTRVMVREKYSFGEDEVGENDTAVYYFPEMSVCRNESGEVCSLPRPAMGDRCVIGDNELRVAGVGYYNGGRLSHIRMNLR